MNTREFRGKILQSGYVNFLDVIISESVDESYDAMNYFAKLHTKRLIIMITSSIKEDDGLKDEIIKLFSMQTESEKAGLYTVQKPTKSSKVQKAIMSWLCCFGSQNEQEKRNRKQELILSKASKMSKKLRARGQEWTKDEKLGLQSSVSRGSFILNQEDLPNQEKRVSSIGDEGGENLKAVEMTKKQEEKF